jgi:hypothetical protein
VEVFVYCVTTKLTEEYNSFLALVPLANIVFSEDGRAGKKRVGESIDNCFASRLFYHM